MDCCIFLAVQREQADTVDAGVPRKPVLPDVHDCACVAGRASIQRDAAGHTAGGEDTQNEA